MNDLIIALYKENDSLRLLEKYSREYQYRPIIYNKGGLKIKSAIFKNIDLKNIGLHTHSYLYHIVQNYENLSEVTIFLLGSALRRWLLALDIRFFTLIYIWL
mgnify:CR=1 FL=1